jgi:2-enoate reductase
MGNEEDIRPCIRGNEGCISRFHTGCVLKCEVNPACGREKEYKISKIKSPKKILIVGGGISGLEAARVAAEIGHDVTLIESNDELGGHMIESSKQEFKSDEKKYFEWILRQVEKNNIKVLLNTSATPEIIKKENPDALIIAIGSEYVYPEIKGAKEAILAGDVLNNTTSVGEKVIVVGGGLIGAETALTLAIKNHDVTIIEMTDQIATKLEATTRQALIDRLKDKKVRILLNQTVKEIGAEYVKTIDLDGKTATANADSVIIATGLLSRENTGLENIIEKTISIGDCIEARNIYHCVHEAWNAVINLS